MRIHYLQHVPFEGLGSIESWALANNHTLTATRLYAGEPLPTLDRFDLLVILGGPMSVHDEAEHVWLKAEKWFIRQVLEAKKPTLGICLGAQLLAEVLGGTITKNRHKEIGWFPITLSEAFADVEPGRSLPRQAEAFHWHGETFTLPKGAMRIASSVACENQGFIHSGNIIALQFHLEMTLLGAEELILHCGDELVAGEYIQKGEETLSDKHLFQRANHIMVTLLDYLRLHIP
jgi:GMP synthase-like glutamine amidotransferase